MANIEISSLTPRTALSGTEEIEVAFSNASYRVTTANLFKTIGALTDAGTLSPSGFRVALYRSSDGAALSTTIGEIATATAGAMPIGGTVNQALVKQSATDYDADWGTLPIAGGGTGAVTAAAARTTLDVYSQAEVDALITAEDLDFAGDSGTGSVDLDSQSLTIATGNASLVTAAASQTLTISLASVLEDLDTLGAAASDGQFIVATGAGAFAYESGSTARASLGLTIGTDVQAYDAELSAIAGLVSAADKVPYFTGSGTASLADFSSFGRSLVDDADSSAARTTLGLVIGTNVQAYDAELSAIAGLTSAADKAPYFTGSGTAALMDVTSFARSILDDASEATFKATVNLEIGTDVQAYDAGLASIAGLTTAADRMIYTTASDTYAVATLTSFVRTLLDDADAATFLTTLGLTGITTAWGTYSPTLAVGSGALTTASASGRYKQIGKIVYVTITVDIDDKGTAAGSLEVDIPVAAASASRYYTLIGADRTLNNKGVTCRIGPGGSTGFLNLTDGTTAILDGVTYEITGVYEAA